MLHTRCRGGPFPPAGHPKEQLSGCEICQVPGGRVKRQKLHFCVEALREQEQGRAECLQACTPCFMAMCYVGTLLLRADSLAYGCVTRTVRATAADGCLEKLPDPAEERIPMPVTREPVPPGRASTERRGARIENRHRGPATRRGWGSSRHSLLPKQALPKSPTGRLLANSTPPGTWLPVSFDVF